MIRCWQKLADCLTMFVEITSNVFSEISFVFLISSPANHGLRGNHRDEGSVQQLDAVKLAGVVGGEDLQITALAIAC